MKRVPVEIEISLPDFDAVLRIPLDLKWSEANRINEVIDLALADPSDAAKFAVCDPSISIGITE